MSSSSASSRRSDWFAAPATAGAATRRPQDAVDHALDMVGPRTRRQSDGEADVGVARTQISAPQDGQDDQDDSGGPVDRAGRREHPADRTEDRLGRLEDEGRRAGSDRRVDPREHHPPEDQQPQRDQQRTGSKLARNKPTVRVYQGRPCRPVARAPSRGRRRVRRRPCGRSPNSARPTRTIVAPSSTATSKSSVMPIDSSGPSGAASSRAAARDSSRRARERRPRILRLGRPAGRPSSGPGRRGRSRPTSAATAVAERRPGAKPGLGRIAVDVDLEQDRDAVARPDLAGEPVQPLGELDRIDRLDRRRTSRAPGGPCSTGAARRGASVAPGTAGALASRLLDAVLAERRQARPRRPPGSRSAGTVLETATSVTAAGSRPTRAHAAAIRSRTRSRAAAERRDRVGPVIGGRPAARRRRSLRGGGSSGSPGRRRRRWSGAWPAPARRRSARPARRHDRRGGLVVATVVDASRRRPPGAGARAPRGSRARAGARIDGRSAPAGWAAWAWRAVSRLRLPSKPVAMTVIITSSPSRSLKLVPKMMFASGIGRGADLLGRLGDLEQAEVRGAGDVEQDALGAGDVDLEQRAGDRLAGGLDRAVLAGRPADAHQRRAGVLHDRPDVGEVEVDQARAS